MIKYQHSYAAFPKVIVVESEKYAEDNVFSDQSYHKRDVEDAFQAGVKWALEQIENGNIQLD